MITEDEYYILLNLSFLKTNNNVTFIVALLYSSVNRV